MPEGALIIPDALWSSVPHAQPLEILVTVEDAFLTVIQVGVGLQLRLTPSELESLVRFVSAEIARQEEEDGHDRVCYAPC